VPTRVVILGDTHIPDFAPSLPSELRPVLGRADLILHTGDVTSSAVLDELAAFAPLRVAMGNRDRPNVAAWGAKDEDVFLVDGVRVALLHDAGPRDGRPRRMRRRFPDADLVVFGHSHIPLHLVDDGVHLLNPGSPTWKRRQPLPTYATVTLDGGQIRRPRIVQLPAPAR
jgi:uncharacterized protein